MILAFVLLVGGIVLAGLLFGGVVIWIIRNPGIAAVFGIAIALAVAVQYLPT